MGVRKTHGTQKQLPIAPPIKTETQYTTKTKLQPHSGSCFGPRPSSESLHLSLANVTLMLKQSAKLRYYVLCGGMVWCTVCCAGQALHSTQYTHTQHAATPPHNT
jgi:hypothetical protein